MTSPPTEAAAGGEPSATHHHHPPPACKGPLRTPARRLARPRSRVEYFVFGLLAEMQGHEVRLYAILLDGTLNRYPKVKLLDERFLPSGGALSNPNDKALVTDLEDKMIEAYGNALVEMKCKAAGGKRVDLAEKILRPQHVGALFAAVKRYKVTELNLANNQLGADGGALVAAALKTDTTITWLRCALYTRPALEPWARVTILLDGPTLTTLAALAFPPVLAVCTASSATNSVSRVAWRSPGPLRLIRPSRRSSLLPCHRTHMHDDLIACTLAEPALLGEW